jgi:hypothetical protein
MFRLPREDPPFTITVVPPPVIPHVGQEKVIVFPEGVPTMGDVALKLYTPAVGTTGVPL